MKYVIKLIGKQQYYKEAAYLKDRLTIELQDATLLDKRMAEVTVDLMPLDWPEINSKFEIIPAEIRRLD